MNECLSVCVRPSWLQSSGTSFPHWRHSGPAPETLKGTSLVARWLRAHRPMQGTQVWSLVWEDSTCHRATTEPMRPRGYASQQEKPPPLEALTQQRRPSTAKSKLINLKRSTSRSLLRGDTGLRWGLRQWKICLKCRTRGFHFWVRKIPWRRGWLSTPVSLPGEAHGQRNLVSYSPWGHKESDTTQRLTLHKGPTTSWQDLHFQQGFSRLPMSFFECVNCYNKVADCSVSLRWLCPVPLWSIMYPY